MKREDIIRLAKDAGLFVAHDSEGQFSAVTDEEIHDLHPDPNKERDRIWREQRLVEILTPFAQLIASSTREECAKVCEAYLVPGIANEMARVIRARH